MTDEQLDEVFKRKQAIAEEVRELVRQRLLDVDPEVEEEVRMSLTETFRFWK